MEIPDRVPIHPDATSLVDLVCGELPTGVAAGVRRHCLVCDECARQVEALLGLRRACGLALPVEARQALTGLQVPVTAH